MIATPIDSTGMDSGSEHSVGSTELAVEEIQENVSIKKCWLAVSKCLNKISQT